MKVAINQPYFFPYIGYFQLIASVDIFVMYGNVQFVKRSWINRNQIFGRQNHGPLRFNLPVKNKDTKQLINEALVSDGDHLKKTRQLLQHNYSKAAYYQETMSFLDELLTPKPILSLCEFNVNTSKQLAKYLGLETEIIHNDQQFSDIEQHISSSDYPPEISRAQRAIMMTKELGGDTYYNLPGGTSLYEKSYFSSQGIQLGFLQQPNITYPQSTAPFAPNLSIIDVLMNCGRKTSSEFVLNYQIK